MPDFVSTFLLTEDYVQGKTRLKERRGQRWVGSTPRLAVKLRGERFGRFAQLLDLHPDGKKPRGCAQLIAYYWLPWQLEAAKLYFSVLQVQLRKVSYLCGGSVLRGRLLWRSAVWVSALPASSCPNIVCISARAPLVTAPVA